MERFFVVVGAVSVFCGCGLVEIEPEAESDDPADVPITGMPENTARSASACSMPGALDLGFGGAGTGLARMSIRPDDGGGVFSIDLNGSGIVAAGQGFGGLGGVAFKVSRLRGDGTVDPSFGGGHVVSTRWGNGSNDASYARAVGRQGDGRVVAIGWFDDGQTQDVALARYRTDGALDNPDFGGDGMPLIDLGGAEQVEGGLVLGDDKLLAVGSRDGQLLVARFTANGALDMSFAGGVGYFTAAQGGSSTAAAVALDRDGNIVVAGSVQASGQSDVLLFRLSCDGALDSSFGNSGYTIVGNPAVNERAVAVIVARNGKIVVAGDSGNGDRDFLVGRFRSNGAPDAGFGNGGLVTGTTTNRDDRAEGLAFGHGGSLLVVGNSFGGGQASSPIVARYKNSGVLDSTFGSGGVLSLYLGDFGIAHSIAIESDGMALIGGGDEGGTPGPGTDLVVARMCL